EGRQDMAQLALAIVAHFGEGRRRQTTDVVVQRVDEHMKRELALQFRRRAREHELTSGVRAPRELAEEPRLADPRLTDQRSGGRIAAIELPEDALESVELRGAPDELDDCVGHYSSCYHHTPIASFGQRC